MSNMTRGVAISDHEETVARGDPFWANLLSCGNSLPAAGIAFQNLARTVERNRKAAYGHAKYAEMQNS